MAKNKITVILGGLAGSGKSTVAKAIAKRFKLRRVSTGDTFRALAKEMGMGVIEFGKYTETHPVIDRELDRRMVAEARRGGVILDGRATAFLTAKARIPATRIFLAVSPRTGAKRVSEREGISAAAALKQNRVRERDVAKRLKALYGLDTSDTSDYDAVIETDGFSIKEIVDLIVQLVRYDRH